MHVGSLDSPRRRLLLTNTSQAAYVNPGHLLFVRDGVLLAQRFDTSALRLTGGTKLIADRIGSNHWSRMAMFSVSPNGVLAFRAPIEFDLGWFDRAGRKIGTLGAVGPSLSPALSPDGSRLAVARFNPSTNTRSIWVFELDRDVASRVSLGPWDTSPVWSPDGLRLAYASERNDDIAIYQKAANGSGQESLLESPGGYPLDWSSDGRFLFVVRQSEFPDSHLLPLVGEDRSPRGFSKVPFNELQQTFSPDGRWLAYSSDESGRREVYIRSYPDGGWKWQVSTAGGVEPRWRGDGQELFFIAADQNLMAVPLRTSASLHISTPMVLFKTHTEGSAGLEIFGRQYVVTSDGKRFLINQPRLDATEAPIAVNMNWTSLLP